MKSLLALLCLFNFLTSYGQPDLFFPVKNEFKWSAIEKLNAKLKGQLIKEFPKEFQFYRESRSLTELDSCLHVFDFNNDGLDDIIFDGWSGGEPRLIEIFINTGQTFEKIFTDYQGIKKLTFEKNRVTKLYIDDWGCCCDYTDRNKIYEVDYSSKIPSLRIVSQLQYINNTVFPESYFNKPVKFEVINNNYNIRLSPVIDDTTHNGYCGELRNGNYTGKLKSGDTGYALAEKKDATGRTWWYVAINPNEKILESLYFDAQDEPKSYKLGWISSRYVKIIEYQN